MSWNRSGVSGLVLVFSELDFFYIIFFFFFVCVEVTDPGRSIVIIK
jgi:hypothetical protein